MSRAKGENVLFTCTIMTVGLWLFAEVVWQQLRRAGINEFDNNHPDLGNVKEAIQTLIKQRYISVGGLGYILKYLQVVFEARMAFT